MRLYTVFAPNGEQRSNNMGMPVLCTTLARALEFAQADDVVQAYGSGGGSVARYRVYWHGSKLHTTKMLTPQQERDRKRDEARAARPQAYLGRGV